MRLTILLSETEIYLSKNPEVFMNKEKILTWLKAALIRAVKTVAQTAIATIGTAAALGQVDWLLVLSTAALAGLLSLLTSLAGLPECK